MKITKRFAKYGSVAAGSAGSDWVVFTLLHSLGINYLLAQGTSRFVGGLFSFTANKFWSFDAGKTGRITVQGRRFLLLYAFSYSLSLLLLFVFVDILNVNAYLSKLGSDGICFVVNFIVMNVYVFKDRDGITKEIMLLVRSFRDTA